MPRYGFERGQDEGNIFSDLDDKTHEEMSIGVKPRMWNVKKACHAKSFIIHEECD